jgi:hypothetical protein
VAAKKREGAPEKGFLELKLIPSLEPKLGRVYSNYVSVSHTKYDFTIRFGDLPPGGDMQRLRHGQEMTIPSIIDIIVVPDLIPGIMQALDENYKRYQELIEYFAKQEKETEVR